MFKENRIRFQEELIKTGMILEGHVLMLQGSYSSPKYDDDFDYFPTKMEPYMTWLTGLFYADISCILHLDTMELTAFYPEPTLEESNFYKHYSLEELKPFGVTQLIYENQIVSFLKDQSVKKICFIYGTLTWVNRLYCIILFTSVFTLDPLKVDIYSTVYITDMCIGRFIILKCIIFDIPNTYLLDLSVRVIYS